MSRPISTTKLSDSDVIAVLNDPRPTLEIALAYGVGRKLIREIRKGWARRPVYETWAQSKEREAAE